MDITKRLAYIYPSPVMKGEMLNPYLGNFVASLDQWFDFVNKNHPSNSKGIFDIIRYARNLDFVFLNWPEEIPARKGGIIQTVFYILLIYYLKFKKIRIFWTFHNKISHEKKYLRLKQFLRKFTASRADYILTHASEGVSIVKELAGPRSPKVLFIHHPVTQPIKIIDVEKKYDILIWGTIAPYKGVEEFLSFIGKSKLNHLKILIAGKIPDPALRNRIVSFRSDNITIIERFISSEEMEWFIAQSRIILFTYLDYSILSSGALMETLRYSPFILGPDCGAFTDLYKEGIILTYRNYDHLKVILSNHLIEKPDTKKIHVFNTSNSWDNFGKEISKFVSS